MLFSYRFLNIHRLHNNEGSYLAHTQGKKHQSNLARRAAKDAKDNNQLPQLSTKSRVDVKKFVKIGRPGYRITKQLDASNNQQSLLFQIDYPEIADHIMPRHRFMSAYEQKIEPPDRHWQYVLFAAEPYETIAFKVPSREVDKSEGKFWTLWNKDSKQFFLQFAFRVDGYSSSGNYSNLNASNQNFVSQNNQLNRIDKSTPDEKAIEIDSDQKMDDALNEFNSQLNEEDEQADEQYEQPLNGQANGQENGQDDEELNELADEQYEQADEQYEQVDEQYEQAEEQYEQADQQYEQVDEQYERADEFNPVENYEGVDSNQQYEEQYVEDNYEENDENFNNENDENVPEE